MPLPSQLAAALARTLTPARDLRRLRALAYADAGHGYDAFGLHPAWVALGLDLTRPAYRAWFRVQSYGSEHIPREGAAILVANHAGILPFDGMMLWTDVLRRTNPPRVSRAVADYFVPRLPLVSTLFARVGSVSGSRSNVSALLDRGELLMIFPEGVGGVGKPYRERYRLQHWHVGHAEMAIRHRAPVIPVAIVGAEEQFPLTVRLPLHAFGAPYLPLSALPLPLPVRYRIHYGAPLNLHTEWQPAQADEPAVLSAAAERVRYAVQALLDQARASRRGVFW
jgi:1-acyl-sn-glycerol-3-phosphate acyltransferase